MDQIESSSATSQILLDGSRFVRALPAQARGPHAGVFLRQAGRYMQEYRDVRSTTLWWRSASSRRLRPK